VTFVDSLFVAIPSDLIVWVVLYVCVLLGISPVTPQLSVFCALYLMRI